MSTPTVLVVDDSESNRVILSRCVRRAGYEAQIAESGPVALEMISLAAPDLVLLDWMMPGLSGMELLRAIRASYPPERLPVIMCTARSASRDVQAALAAGANDFITKPINVAVAIARIEAQLQRRQATRALETMNGELEAAVAQRTRALFTSAKPPQSAGARAGALDEILRLARWLEESKDADDINMRRACAASIAAAARALMQVGA